VGIAADRGSADPVRKFFSAAGVTFPVLLDPEGVVRKRYEVVGLPMSYLIGRDQGERGHSTFLCRKK
jgi:peroxiredoxin